MKIIKAGEVIAELRDKPKDFDGTSKGGTVWVVASDAEVKLAHYADVKRAHKVLHAIHEAYFAGEEKFIMPEE